MSNVGSQPEMFQAPSFLTCLAYVTVILATRIQNSALLNRMRNKYKVHILRLTCSDTRVAFLQVLRSSRALLPESGALP